MPEFCHKCLDEGCEVCTPYPQPEEGNIHPVMKIPYDHVGKREDLEGVIHKIDPKVDKANPKAALGLAKVPLHLVPPVATAHFADAMRDGTEKYGAWNFREVDISASVYVASCKRHLDLWYAGQEAASDSGVHHLGHAMACLGLILDSQMYGNLVDDRPIGNPELLEELFERLKK